MRNLLLILALSSFSFSVYAQKTDTISKIAVPKDSIKHIYIESMPEYKGGIARAYSFLYNRIKNPIDLNGSTRRMMVVFIINEDGSVSDPTIRRSEGQDDELDKEVIRVFKMMPKWIPGKQDGKAVRIKFSMPVSIK